MRRSDRDRKNAIGAEYDVNTLNAADRKQAIIMPLIGKSGRTRDEVAARAKEFGIHVNTLYRWIAKYESEPGILSLAREKRKDDGHKRLPPAIDDIINRALCGDPGERQSLKTVASKVALECRNKGLPAPHYNTVRTRVTEIRWRKFECGHGERKVTDTERRVFSSAKRPLEAILIDSMRIDTLVDQDYLPHARPWLTIAFDWFSRAVLGYYLGIGPPEERAIEQCLVSAILPKDKSLEELGVKDRWPCFGIPKSLLVLNPRDIQIATLERGCAEYKINLKFPQEKHFGSYIDEYMRALSDEIRSLAQREQRLSRRRLQQLLVQAITSYNSAICDEIGRAPIALFKNKTHKSRALKPPLHDPAVQERVRIDFMPFVKRKVSEYGVMICGIYYSHPCLDAYAPATNGKATGQEPPRALLRRDPDDVRRVWVLDPELNEYVLLSCHLALKTRMTIYQFARLRGQFEEVLLRQIAVRKEEVMQAFSVLDKRRVRLGTKDSSPKGSGS